MRKVAVLGAGYVVKPMVDYFIDICKYEVIIATRTVSKAEKVIAGRSLGTSVSWTIDQVDILENIIKNVEVVVAMTPRSTHSVVAELCLKHKTTMITTDFKHPGIACFDDEAKKQETLILTELGEDPGLDNMGLKQMIDEVHSEGAKLHKLILMVLEFLHSSIIAIRGVINFRGIQTDLCVQLNHLLHIR